MKGVREDVEGRRFGMWVVVGRAPKRGTNVMYLCRCDCGVERVVRSGNLRVGKSRGCGCTKSEAISEATRRRWAEQKALMGAAA